MRGANDDPLDDIGMSRDMDIHERTAHFVDELERELGVPRLKLIIKNSGMLLYPISTTAVSWTKREIPFPKVA